MGMLWSNYP